MAKRADKVYEVERILRAIVSYKRGKKISWKYLVKWKGYSDKENTWEPAESFEESPKLIAKFWGKADTGGRDPKSAKSFTLREELSLRDGESLTGSDTEGEEEGQKEGEGEESASPKARGRKRSATAPEETAAKRKRGRPSKAKKDAEEQKSDEDGDAASRRNSRRLSEKTPEKMNSAEPGSGGKMKMLLHEASDSDSASEAEGLSGSSMRKTIAREEVIRKPPMKKRKAYIESDEEGALDALHSDAEGSSHDGSLFSGDEEQVQVQVQKDQVRVADVPGAPVSVVIPKVTPAPEPTPEKKRSSKASSQQLAKRRVKMINDPNVGKALETRVHARMQGHSANATGQTPEIGWAPGSVNDSSAFMSPAKPVRNEGGSYKPTLLTFEKGKLTSHRRKEDPVTVREPPAHTPVASGSNLDIINDREPQHNPATDTTGDFGASEGMLADAATRVYDVMDTNPDFGSSAGTSVNAVTLTETTEVLSAESLLAGPPPTADELLQLSGVRDEPDDLPDFQAVEDVEDTEPIAEANVATPSMPEPTSSSSEQTPGAPAVPEAGTWKQSTIFGLPTPMSIFQKVLAASSSEPPPPVNATKLVVLLRLDPTSAVPIILKDMSPAPSGPKLTDLLTLEQDGPPGKLFPLDVLQHVRVGGSSARIVPNEDCSDEQRLWFSKLVDELEKGVVFIVAIGGHSFGLCSSSHREATQGLGLPSSLVGLSKTAVIQHIAIIDSTLYANTAITAEDLKLR